MSDKVIKPSIDKKGVEYYPITTANAVIHASKHKTIDVITDDLDKKSITIPYYAEFESGGTVSVPISDFEKDLGISWEDFCKYTTTLDILTDSSMVGGETNENYIDSVFTKHFTIYLPEIEGGAVEGVVFHKMTNFQLSWDYEEEDPPEPFLEYQILEFYRQDEYIQINQYVTSCYDEITTQFINPAILKSESTIRTEISDAASQLKNLIDNVIHKAADPGELPTDASLHSIGVIPKIEIKTKSLYDSLIIKNDNYISISDIKINPVELNDSIDTSWWPSNSQVIATEPIKISFYTAFGPAPYTEMRQLTSLDITYDGGGSWSIRYPDSSCLDEGGYSNTIISIYTASGQLRKYNQDVYDEFKNVLAGANNVYINTTYPIDLRNNELIKYISDNGVIECDIPIKESLVYLKEEDEWQKYYSPIKDKSITNEKLSDKINSNIDYINQELKDINSTISDYLHFVIPIELNSDVNLQSGVEYNSNEHFNINKDRLESLRYILLPENASKFYINRITIDLKSGDNHTFAPLSTIYNSSVENESGELENWINFVFIIYSEEYNRKFIVSFNEENYIKLKMNEL